MVLGKLTVWWMTIRALLLALANAVSTGRLVLPPTLPKVRGYFEVAVEVAHEIAFVRRGALLPFFHDRRARLPAALARLPQRHGCGF